MIDPPPVEARADVLPAAAEATTAVGNVVVAMAGVTGAAVLAWAEGRQGIGLALVGLVLLGLVTAVATWTAVATGRPGRGRQVVAAVVASTATAAFLALSGGRVALTVPAVALVAGLGRTRGGWLRLVALGALLTVWLLGT